MQRRPRSTSGYSWYAKNAKLAYSIDRSQTDAGISYISVALGGQSNDIVGSLTLATDTSVATEAFCEEAASLQIS